MSETNHRGTEPSRADGAGLGGSEDDQIQVSDRAILDLMRSGSAVTVGWLSDRLQVTDTAIRQRLGRLMDRGQVVRSSQREGRGRPKHLYRITDLGIRQCGANLEDLAVALWKEVLSLGDQQVKRQIIDGVVSRLTDQYKPEIQGSSPSERSQQVVDLFNRRNVSFAYDTGTGDGRFSVLGCPYPGLSEHDKQICSMEHALFQRLIGLPLERISEGCDGCHCQFVPTERNGETAGLGNGDSGHLSQQRSPDQEISGQTLGINHPSNSPSHLTGSNLTGSQPLNVPVCQSGRGCDCYPLSNDGSCPPSEVPAGNSTHQNSEYQNLVQPKVNQQGTESFGTGNQVGGNGATGNDDTSLNKRESS